jgi:hypothetical protein
MVRLQFGRRLGVLQLQFQGQVVVLLLKLSDVGIVLLLEGVDIFAVAGLDCSDFIVVVLGFGLELGGTVTTQRFQLYSPSVAEILLVTGVLRRQGADFCLPVGLQLLLLAFIVVVHTGQLSRVLGVSLFELLVESPAGLGHLFGMDFIVVRHPCNVLLLAFSVQFVQILYFV